MVTLSPHNNAVQRGLYYTRVIDEAQAGIKTARRNISNPRYAEDTTLMAESEEQLKKPLDESEEGE